MDGSYDVAGLGYGSDQHTPSQSKLARQLVSLYQTKEDYLPFGAVHLYKVQSEGDFNLIAVN
jgi:hypothetical protein